jgi:VIT1/CCC1 family predicted Fe2+/Mn2+ transporter
VAVFSFIAFAIGASICVLPFLFFLGDGASTTIPIVIAVVASALALLLVGAIVGRLSGRGVVFSALRQFLWGAGAATLTFIIGRLVGTSLG